MENTGLNPVYTDQSNILEVPQLDLFCYENGWWVIFLHNSSFSRRDENPSTLVLIVQQK